MLHPGATASPFNARGFFSFVCFVDDSSAVQGAHKPHETHVAPAHLVVGS